MSPPELRPPILSRCLIEWAARRLRTPDLADAAAELFNAKALTRLFTEALVLAALAVTLGLLATGPALQWILDEIEGTGSSFPFWIQAGVSAPTIAYASVLALLGAVIVGIVPALKVTGPGMQALLHQVGPGAGGLRLGGIWTGIVVAQTAATVVFGGAAWVVGRQGIRNSIVQPHFPAEQYLGMGIGVNPEMNPEMIGPGVDEEFEQRYADEVQELKRRVAADPAVAGATLVDRRPVQARGFVRVEVIDGSAALGAGGPESPEGTPKRDSSRPGRPVRRDAVDLDFFEVFRTPVIAGRGFRSGDVGARANTVVVNASFVEEVLGGRNAIGRRIRYMDQISEEEPGPEYEIVGVVRDIVGDRIRAMDSVEDPPKSRVFHPLDSDRLWSYPLRYLIAHVPGDPHAFIPTSYRIAAAVSPAVRLNEVETLDNVDDDIAFLWRLYATLVGLTGGIALILSLTGIYAVTSFTVARRTREIGIRVALGAGGRRVVAEIFRRPMIQVGAGVVIGCVLTGVLVGVLAEGGATTRASALIVVLGSAVLGICSLATIVPVFRALRVEPLDALRYE